MYFKFMKQCHLIGGVCSSTVYISDINLINGDMKLFGTITSNLTQDENDKSITMMYSKLAFTLQECMCRIESIQLNNSRKAHKMTAFAGYTLASVKAAALVPYSTAVMKDTV